MKKDLTYLLLCFLCCPWPGASLNAARSAMLALVRSSSQAEYLETCESIKSTLEDSDRGIQVIEFLLPEKRGDPAINAAFWAGVRGSHPDLIVTVGSPATFSAIEDTTNIPLIYTMVMDDPASVAVIPPGRTVLGFTLQIPPRVQLEAIRSALPTVRRVGMLQSAGMDGDLDQLVELGDRLGIRLMPALVESSKEVPAALRNIIEQIDLLWIPPDRYTYRQDVLSFLLKECFAHQVPVFAVSRQMAVAGAPVSVGYDYREVGRSTAGLAAEFLAQGRPPEGAVTGPPLTYYINHPVAASLGLHIPGNIINNATMVGNEP